MTSLPHGYLLMTNISPDDWRAPLVDHPQIIGRRTTCDIVIPKDYRHVSREHARIGYSQDSIWIEDLESSGGTLLNGVPLVPRSQTTIVIGDRISLGGLELYLVSSQSQILSGNEGYGGARVNERNHLSGTSVLGANAVKTMEANLLSCLTPAELEVVRWVCRGLTSFEDIAKKLYRSPHTVRTHLCNVFRKLDVHSRDELMVLLRKRELAWTQAEVDDDLDDPKFVRTAELSAKLTDH